MSFAGDQQKTSLDASFKTNRSFLDDQEISSSDAFLSKPQKTNSTESQYKRFFQEIIRYNIRSMGIRAGGATLTFEGLTQLDGRDVYLITFTATAMNFLDVEEIYADTENLYPLKITRDLNIWGSKEKITEIYDQENFTVHITKIVEGKDEPEHTVIQKDGIIDNIYCFLYRFRKSADLRLGNHFQMNLPTKDIMVRVDRMTRIKAMGRTLDAYHLRTEPREYEMWFGDDKSRLPLRIDRIATIGGTSMVMIEHSKQRE